MAVTPSESKVTLLSRSNRSQDGENLLEVDSYLFFVVVVFSHFILMLIHDKERDTSWLCISQFLPPSNFKYIEYLVLPVVFPERKVSC